MGEGDVKGRGEGPSKVSTEEVVERSGETGSVMAEEVKEEVKEVLEEEEQEMDPRERSLD